MNEQRRQVLLLYSQGMKPKEITKQLGTTASYANETIYYYHKQARKYLCPFLGEQAKECLIIEGRPLFVSGTIFKIFQAGLTVDLARKILGQVGYLVIHKSELGVSQT